MHFKLFEPKRIGGKNYVPTVAYPLTEELKPTIILLQNMGQAEIIVNPVPVEHKKKSKDKVVKF